ncbi:MAG: hypothetical protein JSV95_12445 [Gemmatimonadota bacterium]|nr:MAG: hypothetical protein JSV95_12445 [Gemmatimonadota bacterium]
MNLTHSGAVGQGALEKRLEISVPEADYPRLGSLSGAIAYLESRGARI